ncbi:ATP-binding protein [Medicago truncatula]|uniref:ATP-binding protein n=1 Tax=Medicago truncatula TaxID=3880 RepID=G7I3H7_MEDTR|nr:ATP-binding protein [Medicago truncatula]
MVGAAINEFNILLSRRVSDISHYNNVFSSLLNLRCYIAIPRLVQQLESQSHELYLFPDTHTWLITTTLNDLLKGLSQIGESYKATLFYHYIILKGFQLDLDSCQIQMNELCHRRETQRKIIFRLCKDRLVNQGYGLYFEMIVNKIESDCVTHHHLIYGYCIAGRFIKEAISLFR